MTTVLKNTLLPFAFATAILLTVSCDNNQKPEDTKEIAEEKNEAKFDSRKQENDAEFLVNAAEINLEEIQLGQLAQQNGKTTHVRELGKMMEEAHTQSMNDLTILAQNKMISIPTSPTDDAKDTYERLNKKTGKDFDEAYADKMVSKHKDAVKAFEKAAEDCNDPEIKNWAATSLPNLRAHLDRSIDCQKQCDKM
jgi:putative membrane protein